MSRKIKIIALLIVLLLILLSLFSVSSKEIKPEVFKKWNTFSYGNESILYNIKSVTKDKICVIPKDLSMKDIPISEEDLTKQIDKDKDEDKKSEEKKISNYKYPNSLSIYKGKEKVKINTKSLSLNKEIDNSICFNVNPSESLFYKIGEESILIFGEEGYNSTDENVTQENRMAHLGVSDNIILYMPFDVEEDSTTKITYDFSNTSNNGVVNNSIFYTETGCIAGGCYNIIENLTSESNYNPTGITQNGTFIWTLDELDLKVYKYWMNGTYTKDYFSSRTDDYDQSGVTNGPQGITQNNTFFWILNYNQSEVIVFWMNGTYTGDHWDTAGASATCIRDITQNNTFIWILDVCDDEVYKYWMNGTYTTDHFDTGNSGANDAYGIDMNNTFFWIVDSVDDEVYKYWMNGTYTTDHWDTSFPSNNGPASLSTDNNLIYITDNEDYRIYKYLMNGTYLTNNYFSLNTPQRPINKIRGTLPLTNVTQNWTFSVWINPRRMAHNERGQILNLMGYTDGWINWYNTPRCSYVIRNGTDVTLSGGTGSCPIGRWSHFVGTRAGANFSIYVDGVLKQTEYIANIIRGDNSSWMSIGSYATTTTGYAQWNMEIINATIDELIIWDKTLSAEEIRQLYNSTLQKVQPTGEMLIQNLNFSNSNAIDISISDCKQINGSYLQAKVNNGDYKNFSSSCYISNYSIATGLTDANITIKLISSNSSFLSPLIVNNIVVTDYTATSTSTSTTTPHGGGTQTQSGYNLTLVCDYTEQFLKERLTSTGYNYNYDDIVNLTQSINVYSIPDITTSITELCLTDFETQCGRSYPKFLIKTPKQATLTILSIESGTEECNPDINKTIKIYALSEIKYSMDTSIPFFSIKTGQLSCESSNFLKWFLKLSKLNEDYYIKGIKLWFILFISPIFIISLFLLKKGKRDNGKRESDKEL